MPQPKVDIRDDLAAIARAKARARSDDELPQLIREELLKLGPLGIDLRPTADERLMKKREGNREYQRQKRLAERRRLTALPDEARKREQSEGEVNGDR